MVLDKVRIKIGDQERPLDHEAPDGSHSLYSERDIGRGRVAAKDQVTVNPIQVTVQGKKKKEVVKVTVGASEYVANCKTQGSDKVCQVPGYNIEVRFAASATAAQERQQERGVAASSTTPVLPGRSASGAYMPVFPGQGPSRSALPVLPGRSDSLSKMPTLPGAKTPTVIPTPPKLIKPDVVTPPPPPPPPEPTSAERAVVETDRLDAMPEKQRSKVSTLKLVGLHADLNIKPVPKQLNQVKSWLLERRFTAMTQLLDKAATVRRLAADDTTTPKQLAAAKAEFEKAYKLADAECSTMGIVIANTADEKTLLDIRDNIRGAAIVKRPPAPHVPSETEVAAAQAKAEAETRAREEAEAQKQKEAEALAKEVQAKVDAKLQGDLASGRKALDTGKLAFARVSDIVKMPPSEFEMINLAEIKSLWGNVFDFDVNKQALDMNYKNSTDAAVIALKKEFTGQETTYKTALADVTRLLERKAEQIVAQLGRDKADVAAIQERGKTAAKELARAKQNFMSLHRDARSAIETIEPMIDTEDTYYTQLDGLKQAVSAMKPAPVGQLEAEQLKALMEVEAELKTLGGQISPKLNIYHVAGRLLRVGETIADIRKKAGGKWAAEINTADTRLKALVERMKTVQLKYLEANVKPYQIVQVDHFKVPVDLAWLTTRVRRQVHSQHATQLIAALQRLFGPTSAEAAADLKWDRNLILDSVQRASVTDWKDAWENAHKSLALIATYNNGAGALPKLEVAPKSAADLAREKTSLAKARQENEAHAQYQPIDQKLTGAKNEVAAIAKELRTPNGLFKPRLPYPDIAQGYARRLEAAKKIFEETTIPDKLYAQLSAVDQVSATAWPGAVTDNLGQITSMLGFITSHMAQVPLRPNDLVTELAELQRKSLATEEPGALELLRRRVKEIKQDAVMRLGEVGIRAVLNQSTTLLRNVNAKMGIAEPKPLQRTAAERRADEKEFKEAVALEKQEKERLAAQEKLIAATRQKEKQVAEVRAREEQKVQAAAHAQEKAAQAATAQREKAEAKALAAAAKKAQREVIQQQREEALAAKAATAQAKLRATAVAKATGNLAGVSGRANVYNVDIGDIKNNTDGKKKPADIIRGLEAKRAKIAGEKAVIEEQQVQFPELKLETQEALATVAAILTGIDRDIQTLKAPPPAAVALPGEVTAVAATTEALPLPGAATQIAAPSKPEPVPPKAKPVAPTGAPAPAAQQPKTALEKPAPVPPQAKVAKTKPAKTKPATTQTAAPSKSEPVPPKAKTESVSATQGELPPEFAAVAAQLKLDAANDIKNATTQVTTFTKDLRNLYDQKHRFKDLAVAVPKLGSMHKALTKSTQTILEVARVHHEMQVSTTPLLASISKLAAQVDAALVQALQVASTMALVDADIGRLNAIQKEISALGPELSAEHQGEIRAISSAIVRDIAQIEKDKTTQNTPENRLSRLKAMLPALAAMLRSGEDGKYVWLEGASPKLIAKNLTQLTAYLDGIYGRPVKAMILQVPRIVKNESQIEKLIVDANLETEVVRDSRITDNPNVMFFFDENDMNAFHAGLKRAVAEDDTAKSNAMAKAAADAKIQEQAQKAAEKIALDQLAKDTEAAKVAAQEQARRESQRVVLDQRAKALGGKAVEVTVGEKPLYIVKLHVQDAHVARQFIKDTSTGMPWVTIENHVLVFAPAAAASGLLAEEWSLRPKNLGGFRDGSRVYELKPTPSDIYIVVPADYGITNIGQQFDGKLQDFVPHLQKLGMAKGSQFAEAGDQEVKALAAEVKRATESFEEYTAQIPQFRNELRELQYEEDGSLKDPNIALPDLITLSAVVSAFAKDAETAAAKSPALKEKGLAVVQSLRAVVHSIDKAALETSVMVQRLLIAPAATRKDLKALELIELEFAIISNLLDDPAKGLTKSEMDSLRDEIKDAARRVGEEITKLKKKP